MLGEFVLVCGGCLSGHAFGDLLLDVFHLGVEVAHVGGELAVVGGVGGEGFFVVGGEVVADDEVGFFVVVALDWQFSPIVRCVRGWRRSRMLL